VFIRHERYSEGGAILELLSTQNSKFTSGAGQCKQVDGFTDHQQIADNFEKQFAALGSVVQNNAKRNMQ